jgi:hypothetical protein
MRQQANKAVKVVLEARWSLRVGVFVVVIEKYVAYNYSDSLQRNQLHYVTQLS